MRTFEVCLSFFDLFFALSGIAKIRNDNNKFSNEIYTLLEITGYRDLGEKAWVIVKTLRDRKDNNFK